MKKPFIIISGISLVLSGMYTAFICSMGDLSPDPPKHAAASGNDGWFFYFYLFTCVLFVVISGIYLVVKWIFTQRR